MEEDPRELLDLTSVAHDQPNIGLQTDYFHFEIGHFENPENFQDRYSFNAPAVIHEAQLMAGLQTCIREAKECISILYTYRSVSRAMPRMKPNTAADPAYNVKVYKILRPQMIKIERIMNFVQQKTMPLIKRTFQEIEAFEERFGTIISDTLFDYLIKLLDAILMLNTLKAMRDQVFLTDFTRYKQSIRAMDQSTFEGDELDMIQNFLKCPVHPISLFLLDKQFVLQAVNSELMKIPNGMKWIITIVNHCVDMFDSRMYVFAEEKHALLRVMVFGIYLVDGYKATTGDKLREVKRLMRTLNQDKMIRCFKEYPYIPLMCDMTYDIKKDLTKCKNLPPQLWQLGDGEESRLGNKFLLTNVVEDIRLEFSQITTDISIMVNRINRLQDAEVEVDLDLREEVTNLCSDAISLIAKWKTQLVEQCAWKYSHPASLQELTKIQDIHTRLDEAKKDPRNSALTIDSFVTSYEKVVRYNYDKMERTVLVDVISMIKGLSAHLIKYTALLAPIFRSHIHRVIQEFAQLTLSSLIDQARSRKSTQDRLVNLRAFIIDSEQNQDIAQATGGFLGLFRKKPPQRTLDLKKRTTPGSATQIQMLRTIISTLYSSRSSGMTRRGLFGRVDFKPRDVAVLDEFYRRSFIWMPLLDWNSTLRRASDLAMLWHREYYLQIEGRIQMPIDNSLPWMLVKNIVQRKNLSLIDSTFYPLSIYDDAALLALFDLQAGHLYEEIEAEVNLVFDQFVFKLAEAVFAYYKTKASVVVLGNHIEDFQLPPNRFLVPPDRFLELIGQKSFSLLGRDLDLNRILGKLVNKFLKDNLDQCIKRCCSQNLSKIMELDSLLRVCRVAHDMLSEHFVLDSFDSLLHLCRQTSSIATHGGKITNHVANELIYDVFQNYIYNSTTGRFVMSPVDVSSEDNPYKRAKPFRITGYYAFGDRQLSVTFGKLHQECAEYFGLEHLQQIIRIIGEPSLSILIQTIVVWMENMIYTDISPYVVELRDGIPPKIGLDTTFGLEGVFYKYEKMFEDISLYDDLRPGVFHSFRVVGNAIAFLLMLDNSLTDSALRREMCAVPFLNIKPLRPQEVKTARSAEPDDEISAQRFGLLSLTPLDRLDEAPVVNTMTTFLHDERVTGALNIEDSLRDEMCARFEVASRECHPKLPRHSIFSFTLERLHATITSKYKEEWTGFTEKETISSLETSKSFSKLIAIFQHSFGLEQEGSDSNHSIFGDGFFFCASTLVYLLGEYDRFLGFNFLGHLLDLAKEPLKGGLKPEYKPLLESARKAMVLNDRIFAILQKYYPLKAERSLITLSADQSFAPKMLEAREEEEEGEDIEISSAAPIFDKKRQRQIAARKKREAREEARAAKQAAREERAAAKKAAREERERQKQAARDAKASASDGLLAPPDASGGLLAPPDANGGLLAPPDASGGLLAPPDASGGLLAPPGGGGLAAPAPRKKKRVGAAKKIAPAAGGMDFLSQIRAGRSGGFALKKVDPSAIKKPLSPKSLARQNEEKKAAAPASGGGMMAEMARMAKMRAERAARRSGGGGGGDGGGGGSPAPAQPTNPFAAARARLGQGGGGRRGGGGRGGGGRGRRGRGGSPRSPSSPRSPASSGGAMLAAPPPPSGPRKRVGAAAPPPDRGGLFDAIRAGGFQLKKVDPNAIKKPLSPKSKAKQVEEGRGLLQGGGGGSLMDQLRSAQLKKRGGGAPQRAVNPFKAAMLARRADMTEDADVDDEEEEEEDEDD